MNMLSKLADLKIVSIDYCLAPENPFPASVEQCYSVVKFIQENAKAFGVDPTRIAIGGHSIGGNFAASICLLNPKRKELDIHCIILDYPPLDIFTPARNKPKGSIPVFANNFFDSC